MKSDVVIGIVGAVALVFVMVGVFAYEYNNFEPDDVEWVAHTDHTGSEEGTLAEAASEDHTFSVDGSGLATIIVSLDWADDVGDADTFTLALLDADGNQVASKSNSGSFSITHMIADMPEGATADDAWDGMQDWTAKVTLDSAPGTSTPIPLVPETEEDGSQAYTLTWSYSHWEPSSE